jgi:ABC-type multidrug transport system fused ATPase/permease subunit
MSPADPSFSGEPEKPSTSVANMSKSASSVAEVKAAPPAPGMASYRDMFRYATGMDFFLFVGGAFMASANGVAMTGFSIILGSVFDALNSPQPGQAEQISLWFVYLGLGAFAAGFAQVGLFTAASERMTVKLRQGYLDSILKQDIGYFDRAGTGELASSVAENALLFREALGEKLGGIFQFGSMFVAGVVVGFTYLWQLTLVILAVAPLLALSGAFMANTMGKLVSGQLESYARAGAIAEESFSLIRTVTGLGVQEKRVALYNKEMSDATARATTGGRAQGLGFGFTFFSFFATYGLAYYVGAVLIANSHASLESQFPLSATPPQPYCRVGGLAPAGCTAALSDVGFITFQTTADVCACYACGCGCYHNGPTSKTQCTSGGSVVLTFFAVLMGCARGRDAHVSTDDAGGRAFGIGQAVRLRAMCRSR